MSARPVRSEPNRKPASPNHDRAKPERAEASPVDETMRLQQIAGNAALSRMHQTAALQPGQGRIVTSPLMRAYLMGYSVRAAQMAMQGLSRGTPLPADTLATASQRLGTDLSDVRVHRDTTADARAADIGADAFTVGQDVVIRRDQYRPGSPEGRTLLLHELAHVAQYRLGQVPGPPAQLERQARGVQHGATLAVPSASLPPAVAPPAAQILRDAPRCTGVTITLPDTITFYGTRGKLVAHIRMIQDLTAGGSYTITYIPAEGQFLIKPGPDELLVEVTYSVTGTESEIKRGIDKYKAYIASMTSPMTLVVQKGGGAGGGAGGTGEGPGGGKETRDDTDLTKGGGGEKSETPINAGTGERSDDPNALPEGDPNAKPGEGTSPKSELEGKKGPIVEITSIAQIEELKKRGMIPVDVADKIEDKLGKQQVLSFEEAAALLDAMNKLIVPDDKDTPKTGEKKTSWVEWAKFIKENQDKLSGKTKAGEKGISPEDVKAILAKHKEYVGVQATPTMTIDEKIRQKDYDAEVRKSWNSLEDWERELWNEYRKKYGGATESDRKDLRITAEDKFGMALRMSPDYMDEGFREAARAMFNDPIFIGGTIIGIAAYLALWLMPEPLFSKAAAVMTTIALVSMVSFAVSELVNLATAWMDLSDETKHARSMKQLEAAAERFGKRIGGAEFRILLALAMIVGGKTLPTPKPAPPMGGGGGMVTAGGPPMVVARPVDAVGTVKVVNGVIVIVSGSGPGLAMSSMTSGGSGSGSGGGGPDINPVPVQDPAKVTKPVDPKTKPAKHAPPGSRTYYGGGEAGKKGMKPTQSDPVVEKAPTKPTVKPASALTADEQAMIQTARDLASETGKPLQVKVKAVAEEATPVRSGFGEKAGGDATTRRVMETAEEIGHDLKRNTSVDEGVPGQSAASHAEKKAAIENPGRALAVDKAMCDDCFAFFQKLAMSRGTQVVHEPGQTWVFRPDGTRIGVTPGSEVIIRPDGTATAVGTQ